MRHLRISTGECIYHVINRANARGAIFSCEKDYVLYLETLEQALQKYKMRLLAYCVMPNHWHLILHPRKDGDLSKFMHWLMGTHTKRYHSYYKTTGNGHIYQGRFKSFLIETTEYLVQACRYIERNPLKASLVVKSEDWKWSSLYERTRGVSVLNKTLLEQLPINLPVNYLKWVNDSEVSDIHGGV